MKIPDEEPEPTQAFYDDQTKDFWVLNADDRYMRINETTLKQYFKEDGLESRPANIGGQSDIDKAVLKTKRENHISYAGTIPGHRKGVIEFHDAKILVTSSPTVIAPDDRPFPLLGSIFENMFQDQIDYFLGWLKCGYECLYKGKFRPGQVLAVAGGRSAGKTLLQLLLTKIFGGREAKPWGYFSGSTDFNSDLFLGEHLAIGDEVSDTDIASRRAFGARIKQVASERVHRCHKKGREAIALAPFWRCSITMNLEDENVLVLPPLDDDHLKDKVMLLKAHKHPMPMSTRGPEKEELFMEALTQELPGLLAWLLTVEIPEEMVDDRMGIMTHRDEELLAKIRAHAPEENLWALIKHSISEKTWNGTALELQDLLDTVSPSQSRGILRSASACGMLLGRLASKEDGRVSRAHNGVWDINKEGGR